MWNFSSPSKMNLTVKGSPIPYMAFHIGSLVHRILEEQIQVHRMPDIDALLADEEQQLEFEYISLVGAGWSQEERDMVAETRYLVKDVCTRYFEHYGAERPLGDEYRYLKAEVTFRVLIPRTWSYLRGTIDGIAVHEPTGQVWLVEHKTVSEGFAKLEHLLLDSQLQAYCWAARVLLGYRVEGIIYDGISKKLPKRPELLANGQLSRAQITTTAALYREAIQQYGLSEDDYLPTLLKLEAKERSPENGFFLRHKIRFADSTLDQFESDLVDIARAMQDVNVKLYPTPKWEGCWDCSFKDLCLATQNREDTTYLLQERYTQSKGWRTTRAKPVRRLKL